MVGMCMEIHCHELKDSAVLFDTALELRSSLVGGKSHSCDRSDSHTVATYLDRAKTKLGVRTIVQAVARLTAGLRIAKAGAAEEDLPLAIRAPPQG